MHPRLILFDVDGTLVDTAGAGRIAMQNAFIEVFRVDAVARATGTVRFAGMTDPNIFTAVAREADVAREELVARIDDLRSAYLRHLRETMDRPDDRRHVLPGVLPLLDELEEREDVSLGLLTGNLESGARIKLEPFGLNRRFPGGGFSSDHADRREIARIAREKISRLTGLSFPPGRTTVIGDTRHDVDCARANGFRALGVNTGWGGRESLEASGPDALFDDLTDLGAVLDALDLPGAASPGGPRRS
jgi:phosphoglycolate phosphatase-like HAD superfamily hydrolase